MLEEKERRESGVEKKRGVSFKPASARAKYNESLGLFRGEVGS